MHSEQNKKIVLAMGLLHCKDKMPIEKKGLQKNLYYLPFSLLQPLLQPPRLHRHLTLAMQRVPIARDFLSCAQNWVLFLSLKESV